ncbi:MAG: HAD hydrolase family protein, partial [Spirochaetales bacterium]|nr:HAD hydrolase family protein [Spirochaetales bacterium]
VYITPEQEQWLHGMLPGCDFLRWSGIGVDVVPAGRDKVAGINSYLDHYGIDRSDYMAFGDGDNDRGMLAAAPVGVAMGNAWESARQAADYVTTDIDDNGIWNALRHYALI